MGQQVGTNKRSWRGKVLRKERKKSAVELQAAGLSERRIAEELGESKSTVHRLLAEANAEAVPDAALVEARRNRIRAVVDGQLESWVPRSSKGNSAAALVVTRFLDRLAKLDGVDAPTKVDVTLAERQLREALTALQQAPVPTDLKADDVVDWVLSVFAGSPIAESVASAAMGSTPAGSDDGEAGGDE